MKSNNFADAPSKPLDEVLRQRRSEAHRSIVVHTQSINFYENIYKHCSQFGCINRTFHYESLKPPIDHILVEYAAPESANNIAKFHRCTHNREIDFTAVRMSKHQKNMAIDLPQPVFNDVNLINAQRLNYLLRSESSVDQQIVAVHEKIRLNEVAVRLRFLAANQIECWTQKLWPDTQIFPFGSTINGLGKMDSDVDLMLYKLPDEHRNRLDMYSKWPSHEQKHYALSKLLTITKKLRKLSSTSELVPVLNERVRVPIVKFRDNGLNLDLDISVNVM